MSLPYFPLYPTDFEADTSHLTLAEDGAYNRLLRLMWMTPGCSLPADDKWLMRRMRCDAQTFEEVVRPVIDEFFSIAEARLFSPRLQREHMLANEAHEKRVTAGRKGGLKSKPLKTNKTTASNAEAMPKQPEPEPDIRGGGNAREGLAPREQILVAMGHDATGMTANGRIIGGPVDMLELSKWKDLGLSQQEIVGVIAHVTQGKRDGPAGAFKYFTGQMQKLAGEKTAPKLKPTEIQSVSGGSYVKPASKSEKRVNAFVSGARGSS